MLAAVRWSRMALFGQANSAVEWSLLEQQRAVVIIGADFPGRE
jgi:hypothetical protein